VSVLALCDRASRRFRSKPLRRRINKMLDHHVV